jgi:hypothetical protein
MDIIVKPNQLRKTASQLTMSAKKIDLALTNIDQIIRSLGINRFEGIQASELQQRYRLETDRLRNAHTKIERFSTSLVSIADRFEQEDNRLSSRISMSSLITGLFTHLIQKLGVPALSKIMGKIGIAWPPVIVPKRNDNLPPPEWEVESQDNPQTQVQQPDPSTAVDSTSAQELHRGSPVNITDSRINSPWTQIDAPVKNQPGNRSAQAYIDVIDQFDVENRFPGRYKPGGSNLADTRCNIFAADVMRAMGVPLPTKGDLGVGHGNSKLTDPMTASFLTNPNLYTWLDSEPNGWRRINPSNPDDLLILQAHLSSGKPAVGCDQGHIAVLRPDGLPDNLSPDNVGQLRVTQAGKYNFNDHMLSPCFKGKVPNIYIHD